MPRSNLMIATFGDGNSISTGASRTQIHGSAILKARELSPTVYSRRNSQNGHAGDKPELLLLDEMKPTWFESLIGGIERVA
jgi:hypothetical protein